MKTAVRRWGLLASAGCATLLALRMATAQVGGDLGAIAGEQDAERPPVYEIEFIVFAYNEFNPLEEEFAPSKPKWSRPLSEFRLTAAPETLPPSSADWYLDSLTLPRPAEPVTGRVPGASAAPAVVDDTDDLLPGLPSAPLEDTGSAPGAPPQIDAEPRTWYRLLEAEDLELGRALARLRTLDAYTPLLHGGWTQEALLEDQAMPFELAQFGRLQPAGTIRLHRSRFLHLTIDISLQDDYRYRQAPIAPDAVWPLAEFRGPTKYSIRTQRRIRSDELHFFDHPAFGVLVIVRPAPEEPLPGETTAPGPAA